MVHIPAPTHDVYQHGDGFEERVRFAADAGSFSRGDYLTVEDADKAYDLLAQQVERLAEHLAGILSAETVSDMALAVASARADLELA